MNRKSRRVVQSALMLPIALILVGMGLLAWSQAQPAIAGYGQPLLKMGRLLPVDATPTPSCVPSWQVVTSPNPSTSGNYLYGVSALSPTDVWAVGSFEAYDSRALILHWDGHQWTQAPDILGTGSLTAVDAVASDDVWAVGLGGNGAPLAVHWDGVRWASVPTPDVGSGATFRAVEAIASSDVWAAGSQLVVTGGVSYYRTLIEHWDGTGWSAVPSPNVGGHNNELYDISAVPNSAGPARDIWAVGYYAGDGEQTLTLHWDGAEWHVVPSPNGAGTFQHILEGVSAVSPNDVWAVGYLNGSPGLLILHWDGVEWTEGSTPDLNTGYYQGISVEALSADDAWIVGYYYDLETPNRTLALRWDGTGWTRAASPNPGFSNVLYGIAALPGGDVLAVGRHAEAFGVDAETLIVRYGDPCSPPLPTPTGTATATRTPIPAQCTISFSDVGTADYFYEPVRYLFCLGAISGYADSTFRPFNSTTRGQLSKIVVLANRMPVEVAGGPHFVDVPMGNPFYQYVETAYNRAIVSGYTCGGAGEPCPGLFFRPQATVTRGQLAKIVVLAQGWTPVEPAIPAFVDVPAGSPFYAYVETAHARGIISGYDCGVAGEPCPGRYFRPGVTATRGQIARIVFQALIASVH